MKFILLLVVCLLGAVVAKPAQTKQKRDILPGDPRYGTDYHHNHHHAHHESNEVEVSRALGGYVGSYSVPEISAYQYNINLQPPQIAYGPPNFTPGQPIGPSYLQPAPQVPQNFQKTVQHQQGQVPSVSQGLTISNFKTVNDVKNVNNGYLSPVAAPTEATTVPTFEPVEPQQEQRTVEDAEVTVLPPTEQETQKPVQNPVDSYGTPIPAYGVPAAQSSSDVFTGIGDRSLSTVQQDCGDQEIPAQDGVGADVHADARTGIDAIPTQAPVHRPVQSTVQHQVSKTVQHSAQPAVQQQNLFQQTAHFPQFYTSGYSGSLGGSFDGFQNFGSLDSGFQSYGTPSIGSVTPQVYNSDFSNIGFGFPQDLNANLYQGGYTTGHVQHDNVHQLPQVHSFGQTQQHTVNQFPQVSSFSETQQDTVNQFPQFNTFGQTQQFPNFQIPQFPNFVPSQVPQFPSFPQVPTQGAQQPAQSTANAQSDSISVTNVNSKQVQPTAVQVNTHSNAASSVSKDPVVGQSSSAGGYAY